MDFLSKRRTKNVLLDIIRKEGCKNALSDDELYRMVKHELNIRAMNRRPFLNWLMGTTHRGEPKLYAMPTQDEVVMLMEDLCHEHRIRITPRPRYPELAGGTTVPG
jgi:hypothetical protein